MPQLASGIPWLASERLEPPLGGLSQHLGDLSQSLGSLSQPLGSLIQPEEGLSQLLAALWAPEREGQTNKWMYGWNDRFFLYSTGLLDGRSLNEL